MNSYILGYDHGAKWAGANLHRYQCSDVLDLDKALDAGLEEGIEPERMNRDYCTGFEMGVLHIADEL